MPLVYQQNINLNTKMGVWHIAEQENYFLNKVSLQSTIRHPHKRLQHLAGRYLLQELFPTFPIELIMIADTRKPFLDNEAFHFSISHCGDYAAAIVSTVDRVGTDIEIPQQKIFSIRHKFLQTDEMLLLQRLPVKNENALTLAWSIKEAIFKWYGSGKVDFRGHIRILKIVFENNQYKATCNFTKETTLPLNVYGIFINDNCLTWVVT